MTTRILVLADTHLRSGAIEPFVELMTPRLRRADAVIHAGDIIDPSLLVDLAGFAPLYAVRGNNDGAVDLPERLQVEIAGASVAVVHDSGPATGRGRRLSGWFPDADGVVFGHSHLPWIETVTVADGGRSQIHLNPGSPTQRRRAPHRTIGWLEVSDAGDVSAEHEIVEPDERR